MKPFYSDPNIQIAWEIRFPIYWCPLRRSIASLCEDKEDILVRKQRVQWHRGKKQRRSLENGICAKEHLQERSRRGGKGWISEGSEH